MIGQYSFGSCTSLEEVYIPDSVISIQSSAFLACSSLVEISIPDSVTMIGNSAFYLCYSLERAYIYGQITALNNNVFGGCVLLTDVLLPDSLTIIVGSAFSGCASLVEISIPDGVTTIQSLAFENCLSLRSISMSGDTIIAADAFIRSSPQELTVTSYSGLLAGVLSTHFDAWTLPGQSSVIKILTIDTSDAVDLSPVAVLDGKILRLSDDAADVDGSIFFAPDGESEILGADRAGKTYVGTDGAWVQIDDVVSPTDPDDSKSRKIPLWAYGVIILIIGAAIGACAVKIGD